MIVLMGQRRMVKVRAYERTRNCRREQVCSHLRSIPNQLHFPFMD